MTEKKKSDVPLPEQIEELSDAQLSQINGGLAIPIFPENKKPGGLKFGQAVELPSCFTKSDDRLP